MNLSSFLFHFLSPKLLHLFGNVSLRLYIKSHFRGCQSGCTCEDCLLSFKLRQLNNGLVTFLGGFSPPNTCWERVIQCRKLCFVGFVSELRKVRGGTGILLLRVMILAQLPTVALHLFTTSPLKSCKCHVVYSTVQSIPAIFLWLFIFLDCKLREEGERHSRAEE